MMPRTAYSIAALPWLLLRSVTYASFLNLHNVLRRVASDDASIEQVAPRFERLAACAHSGGSERKASGSSKRRGLRNHGMG